MDLDRRAVPGVVAGTLATGLANAQTLEEAEYSRLVPPVVPVGDAAAISGDMLAAAARIQGVEIPAADAPAVLAQVQETRLNVADWRPTLS